MSAGLFEEIERRMTVARAFDRWRHRAPWRWLPPRFRPAAFRELFVEREVARLVGEGARG